MNILTRLSPAEQRALLARARTVTRKRGETLFMAEDEARVVYLVQTGLVRRYLMTTEGRPVVIDLVRPGDLLGEAALCGGVHGTFAQATARSTLLVIPAEDFRHALQSSPELGLWTARMIGSRIRAAEQLGESLRRRAASARMAALLLQLAEPARSAVAGLTHQDLGDMIGVYRETATLILNLFKRAGIVTLSPMHVEILRPQALRQVANESRRRSVLTHLPTTA